MDSMILWELAQERPGGPYRCLLHEYMNELFALVKLLDLQCKKEKASSLDFVVSQKIIRPAIFKKKPCDLVGVQVGEGAG